MSDTNERDEPQQPHDSTERRDETEQQALQPTRQGGFGAFSKQYRDRWAANHPTSKRIHGDTASRDAPSIRDAEATDDVADRDTASGSGTKP